MDDSGSTFPFVFNNCISVKAAAFHSGYNVQYLRRLLRDGKFSGVKLGQIWLLDKSIFEAYLENAQQTTDKRFGPKRYFYSDRDEVSDQIRSERIQMAQAQAFGNTQS